MDKKAVAVIAIESAIAMAKPSSRHLASMMAYLAAVQQWTPAENLWQRPILALPNGQGRPADKKLDERQWWTWVDGIRDLPGRSDPALAAVCAAILKLKIPPLLPAAKDEK